MQLRTIWWWWVFSISLLATACGAEGGSADGVDGSTDSGDASDAGTDGGDADSGDTDGGDASDAGTDSGDASDAGTDGGDAGDAGTDGGDAGDAGTDSGDAGVPRPDIVFILVDDMGYGDPAFQNPHDIPDIATPNLDEFAANAVRFTDYHTASSVCAPTRSSLLTGLSPHAAGVPTNPPTGMRAGIATVADVLQDHGYRTGMVGKAHVEGGDDKGPPGDPDPDLETLHPGQRGFDWFFGFLDGSGHYTNRSDRGDLTNALVETNADDPTSDLHLAEDDYERHLTEVFTEKAIDFLSLGDDEQATFLYLAYNAPHTPISNSANFIRSAAEDESNPRRDFYADIIASYHPDDFNPCRDDYAMTVTHLDYFIGEVLDALPDPDNTLVIITSDNGPAVGKNGSPDPYLGRKFEVRAGGTGVFLLARWPARGIVGGAARGGLAMSTDVFPTLLAAAGIDTPTQHILVGARPDGGGAYIDVTPAGRDLLPVLAGETELGAHEPFVVELDGWVSVRRDDGMKLIGALWNKDSGPDGAPILDPQWWLFDFAADIEESPETDLWRDGANDEYGPVVDDLVNSLHSWLNRPEIEADQMPYLRDYAACVVGVGESDRCAEGEDSPDFPERERVPSCEP